MAAGAGGTADALVVDTKDMSDWQFTPATQRWQRRQVLTVPIQYGSST